MTTPISVRSAADRMAGDFTRAAKALAGSRGIDNAIQRAERDRASDTVIDFLRSKAASPGAALGDIGWAEGLADQGGAAVGFIESLRPASLFYRLAPRAQVFPMYQRAVICAALEMGGEQGEGTFLPVVAGAFDSYYLTPRKTGGIVVMSKELTDATDPASFGILRGELQRAAVAAVDDVFISIAEDSVTPSEIAPGDPLPGLKAMLDAVAVTGGERMLFAAGVAMANYLATAQDLAGARLFPLMGPSGGSLLNVDCLVSDRMAPDRLMLTDASGFMVNEGGVDVALATGAALQMKTDPDQAAAELVSLFQTNMVALRVIAEFGCERHRDDAVALADLGGGGS